MKRTLIWCLVAALFTGSLPVHALAADPLFSEPTVPAEWQAKSAGQLCDLARDLSLAGEEKAAERGLLAQYVGYRLLNDAATTRTLAVIAWQDLTGRLDQDMSDQQKASWRTGLRAGYAASQEAVCGLEDKDFLALTYALTASDDDSMASLWVWRVSGKYLTDDDTTKAQGVNGWRSYVQRSKSSLSETDCKQWHAKLVAAFIPTPQAMAAMTDQDFMALVYLLRSLDNTTNASLLIATRTTAKDMASAESVRALGVEEWSRRVIGHIATMSDDMKTLWRTRLKAAFVDDAATLATLTPKDMVALVVALRSLGQEEAELSYASWIGACDNWKNGGGAELVAMARSLGKTGAAGQAARTKVADSLAAQMQGDPTRTATVSLNDWDTISRGLAADMSSSTKAVWADGLRTAFAGGQEALAALTCRDYTQLVAVLGRLDDVNVPLMTKSWMAAGDAWQSLDTAALNALAYRLAKLGRDGQESRELLIDQLTTRLKDGPAAARTAGCSVWAGLARAFSKDSVAAGKRAALAVALRSTFAGNPADLANLKADDFQRLIYALKTLGDTGTDELTRQYMEASDAWKAGNLSWFLQALPASGAEAADARQSLAAQVEADYLADAAAIQAVGAGTWLAIVREVRTVLTPVASSRWAGALRAALLQGEAAEEQSARDFITVVQILTTLGDPEIQAATKTWLNNHEDELVGLPTTDLRTLVSAAFGGDVEEATPTMSKVDEVWAAKLTAGQATPVDCRNLSYAWCAAGSLSQGRRWATRMYQAVLGTEAGREAADVQTLKMLVGAMHNSGMLDFNNQEFPGFAQVAARLARDGTLDDFGPSDVCRHWGLLLKMPQSRATIAAEMTDSEGLLRLGLSKILAWSYEDAGEIEKWQAVIDARLADAGTTGDRKALWLLAKGYARGLAVQPTSFRHGKSCLDEAIAAAQSEGVRLQAVKQRAEYCVSIGRPDLGIQMVDSMRDQFSNEMADELDALCDGLRQVEASLASAAERRRAESELLMERARLARYRQLLVWASEKEDFDAIARLREQITELEAKLGSQEQ